MRELWNQRKFFGKIDRDWLADNSVLLLIWVVIGAIVFLVATGMTIILLRFLAMIRESFPGLPVLSSIRLGSDDLFHVTNGVILLVILLIGGSLIRKKRR